MKILCKECIHGTVCKHRVSYEEIISSFDSKTKVDPHFTVLLDCVFYKHNGESLYSYINKVNTLEYDPPITLNNLNNEECTEGVL